ncbi:hypothetical protein LCGC14_0962170 [marine sediment metagenome]|uniref:Uncharacterized protein n=1 Tax=marine sediment metagenome TaxID=412755 RepID=A0A0F9NIV3_9ZZZZ
MEQELEGVADDEILEELYEDLDDDILKYQESDFLLKHTKQRIRKKLGMNLIVTGESGRGKSFFGLRFLERWNKERFKEEFPSNHVCNTIEEAVILVRGFKRAGEGILIEELSVHAGSRASMTTQNRLFNMFLDICRMKQAVIVGNCPHISFVDKHYSMMAQAWVNVSRVDFKRKIVVARAYWIQTSPFRSEPYKHRYLNDEGDEVDICYMRKPSDKLCKEYEKLKGKSNDSIFETVVLRLQKDNQEKLKQIGHKFLSPREKEAYELKLEGNTSKEAAKIMGLKDARTYTAYILSAKKKIKSPEYRRELKALNEKWGKSKQDTRQDAN